MTCTHENKRYACSGEGVSYWLCECGYVEVQNEDTGCGG